MRTVMTFLVTAVLSYASVLAIVFLFQDRLVYFPLRGITAAPSDRGLAYHVVKFSADDGITLEGWFIPAPNARAVVLFCHGNAGNISHRLESIELFHRLGLSVFIFDYRGYGRSEGKPSEQGLYRDVAAAWRHLVVGRRVPPERIVLFGRSLGAAVAARQAARERPAALILESTFLSVPDLAQDVYPWLPARWLARMRYDTREHLAQVASPVLIVHSRDDEIIPFRHGRALYEAAREPKTLLEIRGDHNSGFFLSAREYVRGLDDFLAAHLRR